MASKSPGLRYHCVTVNPGKQACPAVVAVHGVRLLSAEAPRLPLSDCTLSADCQCTFRHHDDRRAGPRRARDRNERPEPWPDSERRRSIGRRATD
jgi:hypothetical protein